jgi:hypothetical protein
MAEVTALKIGLALPLSNGAKVFGVLSEDRACTCFELTAPDGIVTRLALTDEALVAMVDIRTELLMKDAAAGVLGTPKASDETRKNTDAAAVSAAQP